MRDQRLIQYAKAMRANPTEPEARLWYNLRAKRFAKAKFRHQTVIGSFIADFTCRSAMLVIEVDGDTHVDPAHDAARTAIIEAQGWRVVRFTNAEVMGNMDGVLTRISELLR